MLERYFSQLSVHLENTGSSPFPVGLFDHFIKSALLIKKKSLGTGLKISFYKWK